MKKRSMVIVAISAVISLSGCHEDPTYPQIRNYAHNMI